MPRTKKTVKAEPVVEPKNEVVAPEPAEVTEPTLSEDFAALTAELKTLRESVTSVQRALKALESRTNRELKAAQKSSKRRKTGNYKPSGFVKPAPISDSLAAFLGKPKGSEMARNEVTKEIQKYIVANNLQNPENKREILPDKKLRHLLNVKKSDTLSYFNLQRYMKHHFTTASSQ
jgi:chromatin remodeling complex protein RSC6